MAQIQGADQHFIPRIDRYNQSGEIMAKGLADFGTGLGSAVKAFTVKQEEAKAQKQRSEGVADLLMQFYPGQFKDRKDAIRMAKDPDVTNAFFKFSQQRASADAAAAKVRQDLAQQSLDNTLATNESQLERDKLKLEQKKARQTRRQQRNQGKKLSGPAGDLQDLHTLKDQYEQAGQTEKVSDVNSLIVTKTIQSGELPEKAQMMEFFIANGMAEKAAGENGITVDEAALALYKDISSRPLTPMEQILLSAGGGLTPTSTMRRSTITADDALKLLNPQQD